MKPLFCQIINFKKKRFSTFYSVNLKTFVHFFYIKAFEIWYAIYYKPNEMHDGFIIDCNVEEYFLKKLLNSSLNNLKYF